MKSMRIRSSLNSKSSLWAQYLKNGRIGVMATDTVYGVVGSALNQKTVESIYQLKRRSGRKPLIVLISSLADLKKFGVALTGEQKRFLQKKWPNPLSVVLPVTGSQWRYLHRGTNSLAFRMPQNKHLLKLLKKTGPLVAPSANVEGEKAAATAAEAKKYFGDQVFYADSGRLSSQPSTLIRLNRDGTSRLLRKGTFKISQIK